MSAAGTAKSGVYINQSLADDGLMAAVLEHMDVGICIVDGKLNVIAINSLARQILDFPADLIRPGLTLEALIRFNAARGDFGEGNVEDLVRERLEVAHTVKAESFEFAQADGSTIEVKRSLLADGGFITTYTGNPSPRQTNASVSDEPQVQREPVAEQPIAATQPEPPQPTPQSATVQPKLEPASLPGSVDILVAEDDETNQKTLSDAFESAGYSFKIARNGAEALSMYRSLNPRVMLMNAELPRINGLEVTGAIRSGEASSGMHLPIIGTAGLVDANERDKCIKAGMDYFLPLPINPELLAATVLRCLEGGPVAKQAVDHDEVDNADAEPSGEPGEKPEGQLRVLLAEDNQVNHEVFVELLEDAHHAVTGVWNGREAVVQYIANPAAFDVVMMDMAMPVMSGIEAVEAIRVHERIKGLAAVPIIGVSADTTDALRLQADQAGVNDYLIKPVNVDELLKYLDGCKVQRHIKDLKETAREMGSARDASPSEPSLTIADLARKYQRG